MRGLAGLALLSPPSPSLSQDQHLNAVCHGQRLVGEFSYFRAWLLLAGLYSKGFWTLLRSWTSCTIFARASTTSGWRNEIFKSSITWLSVSSPGQTRKLSSIPARVQRRCTRSLRFSSDIWRSRIFSRCWQERSFCSAFAFCCGGKQDRFWVGSMASRSYFKNKLFYAGWTVLSSLIAWLHTSTMYCGTVS